MKKIFLATACSLTTAAAVMTAAMTSCGGGHAASSDTATAADSLTATAAKATADIERTWQIENVVVNDTLYARPADIDPDHPQTLTFAAGTFGIKTNCNTLGGDYTLRGDSIAFANIITTEMACDNMEVETLLMRILPEVNAIDWTNDSVMRLNTPSSAYIVLKK